MIWLWAWPAIGFLFGLYLVFSDKGGGRRWDSPIDGLATDIGWLVLLTIAGPIPPLLIACAIFGMYFRLGER